MGFKERKAGGSSRRSSPDCKHLRPTRREFHYSRAAIIPRGIPLDGQGSAYTTRGEAIPPDIENAHRRLLELQQRGMKEMETIQIPLESGSELESNLDKAAKEAAAHVAGQCFEDAILRLASVVGTTRPDELRKRIEDPNSGGVFTQLFASATVRPDGKISDSKPPLAAESPKEREEAVLKEMYSQARTIDWKLRVQVSIEPARRQIVAEHPARLIELL